MTESDDRRARWEVLQREMIDAYRVSPVGVFTYDQHPSITYLTRKLLEYCRGGRVLDVGCGCLPRPGYMCEDITWVGVDPCPGDVPRQFEFHTGFAESLPFPDSTFDGVFFGTSLDHLLDPTRGIHEAARVLKTTGKLLIWYSPRVDPMNYQDEYHQWGHSPATIRALLSDASIHLVEDFLFAPAEQLAIGVKEW